uniref:EGF-like domain-containing protein n=1 Tax=Globodera pallida TaxID=36090 RepID=A0A183C9Z8_GLOPA
MVDVNECEEAVPGNEQITVCPQENTVCTNFVGGFDCQCKSGFSGDPLTGGCKDINECEMADHYCGSNANCTNLVGTFRCECLDGFERVPNTSNGECKDIDECTLHAACHRAATCTNNAMKPFCFQSDKSARQPTKK